MHSSSPIEDEEFHLAVEILVMRNFSSVKQSMIQCKKLQPGIKVTENYWNQQLEKQRVTCIITYYGV